MTTVRITDAGGNKPTFVQWDVDRVLCVTGVASQPCLHFANAELKRAIVVEAEEVNGKYTCKVPNFILQFALPVIVSVFTQPEGGEGRTVATVVIGVQPKKKPQDYTYEENIGYINWVNLTVEIQRMLDDGELKGEKGDKGDKGDKGEKGDKGDPADYTGLTNKPSINSVELDGNKTASDLGLVSVDELGYVTPQMFGAKGSGIIDDTEAFQNAIAYAKNNNIKIIFVPNGTYLLSDSLSLFTDCVFCGTGIASILTISQSYQTSKLITNDQNASNISIKNINIQMDDLSFISEGNVTRGIIALESVNGILIDNVTIHNNYTVTQTTENQPIWLQSCSNVEIKNCNIVHYGMSDSGNGNGIWIFSKYSRVKNINIHDCYFEGKGDEFIATFSNGYDYNLSNVNICNNVFNYVSDIVGYGIILNSNDTSVEKLTNVKINNNEFNNAKLLIQENTRTIYIKDNAFNITLETSDAIAINTSQNSNYVYDHELSICGNRITSAQSLTRAIVIANCFYNSFVENNVILTETLTSDTIAISLQGDGSIARQNEITLYATGISVGNTHAVKNIINNCSKGMQTIGAGFNIDSNYYSECGIAIEIATLLAVKNIGIIKSNIFDKCTNNPILISANMTQGRGMVFLNVDYNDTASARSFFNVTGTAKIAAFQNYRYRTGGYSWDEYNSV